MSNKIREGPLMSMRTCDAKVGGTEQAGNGRGEFFNLSFSVLITDFFTYRQFIAVTRRVIIPLLCSVSGLQLARPKAEKQERTLLFWSGHGLFLS